MAGGFAQRFKGRAAFAYNAIFMGGGAGIITFTNAGAPTNGGAGTLANIAGPGALLIDTTNKLVYRNNNTLASPTWVQVPFPGTDTLPSTTATFFGGGSGTFLEEGNVNRQISSAGVNPGATGADNVVAVYTVPASSFDALGRGLNFLAQGSFAANGNTKRIKIIFNPATAVVGSTVGAGGTTIADTGAVTTNSGGWALQAEVYKYGAGGSNTQIGLHQQAQIGAAVAALLAPSLITATESGAILVAVTANCTTAATDVVFNFFAANAMN